LGDLIEDGVTGSLVEVGDDAGMTAAIVQLLGDEDMRRRMGEEGKRLAAGRFRAAVVAARYRDLYRQVSSNP
jgi:glycosyltransferase involved in cell wall biosynthesis